MSILNVEHLSHGFGDRAIFTDVSFRLLKGEHIGLIGANGEGKSTFMSIITDKLMPDEGKVEWAKNVRVGYLDQHTVLEKGMTIREVLKSAFSFLFEMEEKMNQICDHMGEASEEEMNSMMEELGDYLSIGYFEQEMAPGNTTTCIEEIWKEFPSYTQYEVRSALAKCGLTTKNIESQVRVLSGGEQAKVRLCKLINRETNILLLDEPTNHLDVDAKEELKRALKEYKGAVLLICHEPEFYDGLVSKVWNLGEYSLKI